MSTNIKVPPIAEELKPYASQWVALVDEKVVATGESLKEVEDIAEQAGHREYATFLVPPSSAIFIPTST
jgi:hypothetical protein